MKNFSIILIAGLLLAVFCWVFVAHHLDVPDRVRLHSKELRGGYSSVPERIMPVGQLNVAAAAETKPASAQAGAATPRPSTTVAAVDGQKVYESVCVACHGPGIAGAPKFGNASAWTKRIAKGVNTLYASAIGGTQSRAGVMPAKGGNAALSDAEVKAAVDYMVAKSK